VEHPDFNLYGDTITLKQGSNIYNVSMEHRNEVRRSLLPDIREKKNENEISGILKDKVTDQPIYNAYVVWGDLITRSDRKGRFSFFPEKWQEKQLIIQARKYDLFQKKTGPVRNMNIQLEPKTPYNEIYGTVISAQDFLPVPDLEIKIGSKTVRTSPKGNYFLKNIPSGEYPIIVENKSYKMYSDVVKIYRGKQNYDIILKPIVTYGYVFGYVKKKSNLEPLVNALVAIGTVSVKTDEHGFFELYGVRQGKTEIVVIKNSKEIYRGSIIVVEGKQQNDILY
jgi:hypothetical protein